MGLLALLLSTPASADPITLTFDELPFQSIDGVTINGVTFGFTVGGFPSADAFYNSTAGPDQTGDNTQFLDLNTAEGSAFGKLTMDFLFPVTSLSFGAALDTDSALYPGFSVQLLSPSLIPFAWFWVNTTPQPSYVFSEAQFVYYGAEVGRAVLNFDATNGACAVEGSSTRCAGGRFALDNLTYNPVPEPASLSLFGLGAVALRFARRRRQA
jgi:hypothetical protein